MSIYKSIEFIAHRDPSGNTHHILEDHLQCVANLASEFTSVFQSQHVGFLAGLWHDLGKYHPDFQNYIRNVKDPNAHIEENSNAPKKVDHSSAGALLAAQNLKGLPSLALAFAIAGHHAGLYDSTDLKNKRILNPEKKTLLDKVLSLGLPQHIIGLPEPLKWQEPNSWGTLEKNSKDRRKEFWIRMIFSALCDADFLDTEQFFDLHKSSLRGSDITLQQLSTALDSHIASLEEKALNTEVNAVRKEIRGDCQQQASLSPGFFSLTVPTGGGKTLASMSFALRHALAFGQRRVIVCVPFTAIIEQSARVYTEAFGSLGPSAVLQHHSALDPEKETYKSRISCENWDLPIIVTTTVQFFESMFARRTSKCRKLHNIAQSVIVLDEAQTLPTEVLSTLLDGLQTLVDDYHCSVVICTATQPAWKKRDRFPCGITPIREINQKVHKTFSRLHRVRVQWPDISTPTTWESLAIRIKQESDALAIVHRRKDARDLCIALDQQLGHTNTVHLSALMVPAHRRKVLDNTLQRKANKEEVRVVSTQLVEAGVDVDFRVVFRALAGMDALAQAAGRCNREGLLDQPGLLEIFLAPTKPPKGTLKAGFDITLSMLKYHSTMDLFSPEVQEEYFQRLYDRLRSSHDPKGIHEHRQNFHFEQTALAIKLIDDAWSEPLVVPIDEEAQETVAKLNTEGPSRKLLRKLQLYTVNVSKRSVDFWIKTGSVSLVAECVNVLSLPFVAKGYDSRFGLDVEQISTGTYDPSVLVVDDNDEV